MKLRTQALSQEERELVHKRTLEILETAGVCVKSARALKALAEGGAEVDFETQIAKIPESLIRKCLDTAPKNYVLGARNPKFDFPMPAGRVGHILDGITTNIIDLETGEKRPSTKEDVYNTGRVFQQMDMGAVAWSGCSALDMPPETHCLHEFAAILQGTSKHIQFELRHAGESGYAVEILKAVLGTEEEVKKRRIASVLYCPISPLTHDDSMLDAYLELSEYEVPVNIYPCPIVGMTAPASVFSTVCLINAEVLSGLVIFQLIKPGLPLMYGSCSGTADPRTGDYVDKEESVLISMASREMAKFYNLPSVLSGGGSPETVPQYMIGPELIDGIGTMDDGMTTDLAGLVMQNEFCCRNIRIAHGIRVDEETDLTAEIIKQGPGGGFLGSKTTRKLFRDNTEVYVSKHFPDSFRHTATEHEDMRKHATEIAKKILGGPVEDELPQSVQLRIDEICKAADKQLAKQ
ncbi:MAG TPA: trimethylamine methyltransferase family protein [Anaerovoracaceae bacterium]|nr:trimethylamine methyltransferase family protein [Anaerovoracaceae bacterium]